MIRSVLTCVVLLSLAPGCRSSEERSAMERDGAARFEETRVTTADGVGLHVRVIGRGPDTVIVPAAAWLARDLAPLASERTLIFYDPRARGGSDAVPDSTRLGIEHDLRDLDVIRRHFGLERASLIGWSYLGAVVALYAERHPERVERLVQVGPMPPTTELSRIEGERGSPPDSADLAALAAMEESGRPDSDPVGYCREFAMRRMIRPMMGRPDSAARALMDPCLYWNEWPDQLFRTAGHVIPAEWDYTEEARRVEAPVLTIHGTEDPNAAVEGGREWASLLPNAGLVELEGVGHAPWLEAPDRFFAEVNAFLRSPAEADPVAEAEAVEARLVSFFDAIEAWDYEALEATATSDFQLIEDTLVLDMTGFVAFIEPLEGQGASISYTLEDFDTEVEGPVAWTSYRNRAVLTAGEQRSDFEWLESAVFRKIDGEWRIDRLQSTPVRME